MQSGSGDEQAVFSNASDAVTDAVENCSGKSAVGIIALTNNETQGVTATGSGGQHAGDLHIRQRSQSQQARQCGAAARDGTDLLSDAIGPGALVGDGPARAEL